MENNINGIINIYKEAGFTSHDVVAKLRGILKIKKIGHTGTLDPEAVGVLPVCIGNATKICDMLTDETKEYVALLKLGIVTDTQDMTGNIIENNEDKLKGITAKDIEETICSFKGEIEQIPPMYSALKQNGVKLYELARQGIEVERKPRRITIERIDIMDIDTSLGRVKMKVVCSKGTYIRTLCHDIGNRLGVGGCMEHLERTRVGIFTVDDAYTLSEIESIKEEKGLHNVITPIDSLFKNLPALYAKECATKIMDNGNQIPEDLIEDSDKRFIGREKYRIYSYDKKFYGIYEYHSVWKVFKIVKIFLPV